MRSQSDRRGWRGVSGVRQHVSTSPTALTHIAMARAIELGEEDALPLAQSQFASVYEDEVIVAHKHAP